MKHTNRLRVVRAEQRVTQGQVAAKTKSLTQTRISLIENGYAEPTPAEKKAIARALRVQVQDVFPEQVTA